MKKLYHKQLDAFGGNNEPPYLKSLGKTSCKNWNDVRKVLQELKFSREKKASIHKLAQSAYDRILENEKESLDTLDEIIVKQTADVQAFCNLHEADFSHNKKLLEDFEIIQIHNFKIKEIKKLNQKGKKEK